MYKVIIALLIMMVALPLLSQHCGSCPGEMMAKNTYSTPSAKQIIPKAKANHWINDDYYVSYEWNKSPKIGTYILMVNVYNKNKKQVSDLIVTADAYMPSMKGSHDTGDKKMQLNKKNQYAIPVYFMMLGDWEIELKFNKANKQIGNAFVKLDIK